MDDDVAALIRMAREGAPLERQREALADYLRGRGVSQAGVDVVLAQTRDGVGLFEEGGGRSRLGGPGLLPEGETWPHDAEGHALTFIGAIDLSEMPDVDPLPRDGTLLVYWNHHYFELEPMDFVVATRVFHAPPGADLVEHAPPDDLYAFGPVPLRGFAMPLPGGMSELDVPDEDADPLYEAADALHLTMEHQLLGTSRDVQGPVLEEIDYWFEGHVLPETSDRYSEAERRGEGWLLLAQIEETEGLTFADAGALYLVVPEVDLRAGRFDRVMGILQSA